MGQAALANLQTIISIIHVAIVVMLVIVILLQQGKSMSSAFGGGMGASQTVFGSKGSVSFFLKCTAVLGILFFATSLILDRISAEQLKAATVLNLPAHVIPVTNTNTPSSKIPVGL